MGRTFYGPIGMTAAELDFATEARANAPAKDSGAAGYFVTLGNTLSGLNNAGAGGFARQVNEVLPQTARERQAWLLMAAAAVAGVALVMVWKRG